MTPTLLKAIVNSAGTKVILSYNETLAVTTAAASAFTVTVAGSPRTVNSVSVVGGNVELTLASASAVTTGQAVTVAYTDPTASNDTNAVQDSAGNDAASIANIPRLHHQVVEQAILLCKTLPAMTLLPFQRQSMSPTM